MGEDTCAAVCSVVAAVAESSDAEVEMPAVTSKGDLRIFTDCTATAQIFPW